MTTSSATLLRDLSAELSAVKTARFAAERELVSEGARLREIALLCDVVNNNTDDWDLLSSAEEMAEKVDSDVSSDSDERDSSSESLNALLLEEKLVIAELTSLRTESDVPNDAPDDDMNDDADDEELREFRKVENDIKVSELTHSLRHVRTQLAEKRENQRKRRKRRVEAPLADSESLDDRLPPRQSRPLTLYLPQPAELDLNAHVRELGHDLAVVSAEVVVNRDQCFGELRKLCRRSARWRKRFFLFDRFNRVLVYFESENHFRKNQNKPKSGVHFDEIRDVFVDHVRSVRVHRPVFCVATEGRVFVLSARRPEAMRVWVDVVTSGALNANSSFE